MINNNEIYYKLTFFQVQHQLQAYLRQSNPQHFLRHRRHPSHQGGRQTNDRRDADPRGRAQARGPIWPLAELIHRTWVSVSRRPTELEP